ncbi:metal-sulfur cluster assembly factor [Caldalkalibacillus mannanilyticus]|uniref:metal-sulfur cluster assembly factor n=1 Tax=Caldalkalibacillus mannanilyticus TaxID=1418 RepID=UPI000469596B|nr:metal-sulfur cluster assembly factor [Caldalkalibacillus mannanilyticus]
MNKNLEQKIIQQLKQVLDPELGINVYDLGLIYSISKQDDAVTIKMTLTTPGCPLHDSITSGVQHAVAKLEEVHEVKIDLVWTPAWNPTLMSPIAKTLLGWG